LLASLAAPAQAQPASSALVFMVNASTSAPKDYARLTQLPGGFGSVEFTVEVWIKPDTAFPVGSTRPENTEAQRRNWSDADITPYSRGDWWFEGNFLLDGHNNASFGAGTFSLQWYGGGRVRWLVGDGACACPGDIWSVGAHPATQTPSLLDGNWHALTLVRRWSGASASRYELWVDGALVASETSPVRTDLWDGYWRDWASFPTHQEGWFWGEEKQAAIGALSEYEDYKGLVDELRLWTRAKSPTEIASRHNRAVIGTEPGLAAAWSFDGGSLCSRVGASACLTLSQSPATMLANANPPLLPSDLVLTPRVWLPTLRK
jgi:hypothetical protein